MLSRALRGKLRRTLLNCYRLLIIYFSYIDWIHLDIGLDIPSNRSLHRIHYYRWFYFGWHCYDNNFLAFCKPILTTKCEWSGCRVGLLIWCAYERILSTIGSTPFRFTRLLSQSVPKVICFKNKASSASDLLFNYFSGVINSESFFSRLFGNTIWLVAIIYYIYITFLGYNCKWT